MRTVDVTRILSALLLGGAVALPAQAGLKIDPIGRYTTGLANVDEGLTSGETVALRKDRMYVANATDVSLDIVDVSNPSDPRLIKRVSLKDYGAGVNSVDVSQRGLVAVALAAPKKTDPGQVVLLNSFGRVLRQVQVGSNPDMLTFTPDGRRLLVANEGEPDCYGPGCTDPVGSVSVVEVAPLAPKPEVHTIGFENVEIPDGVRIFGPGATAAQDLEPEYITVSDNGRLAWVTLQENNAIARLNLKTLEVEKLFPLGYKDHSIEGQGLDASDKDGVINIQPWPQVLGLYQPDAIAQFKIGKQRYLATANEGDARDYEGFEEEVRADEAGTTVPDTDDETKLGRLTVTSVPPAGDKDNLYAFGARSISIWRARDGALVWDSGDEIEQETALRLPEAFNSNNDENDSFDNRSDNKGPEPEGITVGRIGGRTYAFVGLERIGGVIVYDVTRPQAPVFVDYVATRDFSGSEVGPDSGPEVLHFIDPKNSPNNRPMLLVANEITGTINLMRLSLGN